jgi:hypothetical protein
MSSADPQFLYMILVLPSVFGLTLIGDGFNKLMHNEGGSGMLSVVFGLIFIGVVAFAYFFFSTFLGK